MKMIFDRDLYKTKLCTLYRRGHCPRQSCNFAHGNAELRRFSGSGYGRHEFRGGDLRERLERRHSPHNRSFLSRDTRGRHTPNERAVPQRKGRSRSRSPPRGGDRRERKRQKLDEYLSDGSADLKYSGESDIDVKEVHSRDAFEEELKEIQTDIVALVAWRDDLEACLESRKQEVDRLTAKNSELEKTLLKEQDEYKRIGSKIKKFIKMHLRFVRAQEEMKKSQARLQKLVEEFPLQDDTKLATNAEDSDVNVVSDGEQAQSMKQVSDRTKNRAYETSDPGKDDINVEIVDADDNESTQKDSSFNPKSGAFNHSDKHGSISHTDDKAMKPLLADESCKTKVVNSDRGILALNRCEDNHLKFKRPTEKSSSPLNISVEKTKGWETGSSLPSTGIAAHAEDEVTEVIDIDGKEDMANDYHSRKELSYSLQSSSSKEQLSIGKKLLKNLSSLANSASNNYDEYKGNDEEVDIDKVDVEERCFDLNLQAEIE
eukprot:TRINITY_DN9626_c0_g3_i1.p1 TRINITY_DN9626_c0_g3~~TRINITY_DN9626_c0_g3_i1.p1  ORF type:complete len:488 (-),score=129.70 TRINITY_DN9626_c0_g3_i1:124-1587(-)